MSQKRTVGSEAMASYLGITSNSSADIAAAVERLRRTGLIVARVSPLVTGPAGPPPTTAVHAAVEIIGPVDEVLERIVGTDAASGTRIIDLTNSPEASPPDFPFTPLLHLVPSHVGPNTGSTLVEATRRHPDRHQPLWMGILNVTPDSFSDGGRWTDLDHLARTVVEWIAVGVHIIDVGAESTRPGAAAIDPDIELRRLRPVLEILQDAFVDVALPPLISIDSRNAACVEVSLEMGADVVNDVTGLQDPDILAVVASTDVPVVAMHSLTVPVDPRAVLPTGETATSQIEEWIVRKQDQWSSSGIDLDRILVDPGIGFGKSAQQSIDLLSDVDGLRRHGQRVVIGHSRKSFMNGFTDAPSAARDPETLGISLRVASQGADVIRVHDPVLHLRAHEAANQLG